MFSGENVHFPLVFSYILKVLPKTCQVFEKKKKNHLSQLNPPTHILPDPHTQSTCLNVTFDPPYPF